MLKKLVESLEFQGAFTGLLGLITGELGFLLISSISVSVKDLKTLFLGILSAFYFYFWILLYTFPIGLIAGFILAKLIKHEILEKSFNTRKTIIKGVIFGIFFGFCISMFVTVTLRFRFSPWVQLENVIVGTILTGVMSGLGTWYLVCRKFPGGIGINISEDERKKHEPRKLVFWGGVYGLLVNPLVSLLACCIFLFFFSTFPAVPQDWFYLSPDDWTQRLILFADIILKLFVCCYFPHLITSLILGVTCRWRIPFLLWMVICLEAAAFAALFGIDTMHFCVIYFPSGPVLMNLLEGAVVLSSFLLYLFLGILLNRKKKQIIGYQPVFGRIMI